MSVTTRQPTGQTSPTRMRLGAFTMLAGAGLMVVTTLAGVAPPQNLLILGLILVAAWLVDGGTTRYVGPGLTATAIGAGLTLGSQLELSSATTEHVLVYTFIGLAILYSAHVNPENIRGAALLLVLVGASAANQNFGVSFNLGWEFVAVLAGWGVLNLTQSADTTETTVHLDDDDRPVEARHTTGAGQR